MRLTSFVRLVAVVELQKRYSFGLRRSVCRSPRIHKHNSAYFLCLLVRFLGASLVKKSGKNSRPSSAEMPLQNKAPKNLTAKSLCLNEFTSSSFVSLLLLMVISFRFGLVSHGWDGSHDDILVERSSSASMAKGFGCAQKRLSFLYIPCKCTVGHELT